MLRKIDHVGVAVDDLEAAIRLYSEVWGMTLGGREIVEGQGVEEATFMVGDSKLQLLHPLQPDTYIGRFLATRGQGIHHIAYEVQDVAEALGRLKSAGMKATQKVPVIGSGGRRIAFIHPGGNRGVLVELVEQDGAAE